LRCHSGKKLLFLGKNVEVAETGIIRRFDHGHPGPTIGTTEEEKRKAGDDEINHFRRGSRVRGLSREDSGEAAVAWPSGTTRPGRL